jgi:hypothetical protein
MGWIKKLFSKKSGKIALLKDAYFEDIQRVWGEYKKENPDKTPYALVLYGVEGGDPYLWPAILTEEGLKSVAQEYMDKGHMDTLEVKWSTSSEQLIYLLKLASPNS